MWSEHHVPHLGASACVQKKKKKKKRKRGRGGVASVFVNKKGNKRKQKERKGKEKKERNDERFIHCFLLPRMCNAPGILPRR